MCTSGLLGAAWLLAAAPASAQAPGRTAASLLAEANELKEVDAWEEAILVYEEALAATTPGDSSFGPALYNQSVSWELLGRFDAAVDGYSSLLEHSREIDPVLARDALFRRGLSREELGDDKAARRDFIAVRRLSGDDVAVASVDVELGWIDLRAGRRRAAQKRLVAATAVLRDDEGSAGTWPLAHGLLGLGVLLVDEAERIPLSLRGRGTVTQRLGQQARLLERAQAWHVAAAEQDVPRWSAESALSLGDAYARTRERLRELLTRVRADRRVLGPTARTYLENWLEERIPPMSRKADQAWNLCLHVFEETGLAHPVVDVCRSRTGKF